MKHLRRMLLPVPGASAEIATDQIVPNAKVRPDDDLKELSAH